MSLSPDTVTGLPSYEQMVSASVAYDIRPYAVPVLGGEYPLTNSPQGRIPPSEGVITNAEFESLNRTTRRYLPDFQIANFMKSVSNYKP